MIAFTGKLIKYYVIVGNTIIYSKSVSNRRSSKDALAISTPSLPRLLMSMSDIGRLHGMHYGMDGSFNETSLFI